MGRCVSQGQELRLPQPPLPGLEKRRVTALGLLVINEINNEGAGTLLTQTWFYFCGSSRVVEAL